MQAHLIILGILGCANLGVARAGACCLLGVVGLVASIVTAALHNPLLANVGSPSLGWEELPTAKQWPPRARAPFTAALLLSGLRSQWPAARETDA